MEEIASLNDVESLENIEQPQMVLPAETIRQMLSDAMEQAQFELNDEYLQSLGEERVQSLITMLSRTDFSQKNGEFVALTQSNAILLIQEGNPYTEGANSMLEHYNVR